MILLRCYPKITDWIYEVAGQSAAADFRFLPIYSYGFFVALGFIFAASLAAMEMKRREKLGLMPGVEKEVIEGEGPNFIEAAIYLLVGFFVFFKMAGFGAYRTQLNDGTLEIRDYFLSMSYGSWIGGIIGAAILAGYYWYSNSKTKLAQPIKKNITVFPSDRIGDLVVLAAVFGVLGSNLFNFFENPDDYKNFWDDPIGSMFSGLSVYGGLICAGIAFAVYAYFKKIRISHFFDSVAPGFILANGIGRIGCQVSGDGDWGLANPYPKPGWMPQWLWSDTYAHHIISCDPNVDVPIPGCVGNHCCELAHGAYPTPIYEFMMCTAIFIILWSLRKRLTYKPGMIFTIFMILIGIQRFAIEQWRDLSGRDTYGFFGMQFRQSELISITLVIIGIASTAYLYNYYKKQRLT